MNINKMKKILVLLLLVCVAEGCLAKVKLPALVSDGMVLQCNRPLTIWGFADPNEAVRVTFQKQVYNVHADAAGKWQVELPSMKSGGPYEMQINDLTLRDILIGDVYLCSGQSNMELPVRRVTDLFADEIRHDANEQIRHIKIPLVYDFHAPLQDVLPASWKRLTPENALDFSAVAYFFAKELYARTKRPIGLINASVGGSPVEAWMSEDALQPFPQPLSDLRICQDDDYVKAEKAMDAQRRNTWNDVLYRTPSPQSEW